MKSNEPNASGKCVYALIVCHDQSGFTDNYGESAYPSSSVLAIYANKQDAEREMERREQQDRISQKLIYTDPESYFVEEFRLE